MWSCLAEKDLITYFVIVKTTKFQQSIMLYCKLQYAISLGIILAIINYDYKKEYRNITFILPLIKILIKFTSAIRYTLRTLLQTKT